jgi:5-methyltetrahydrofolate--homocysteine methyltransferase
VRRWTDLDYIAELNDFSHRHTFYGGEAFPIWSGGYPGHTAIPTFLGCPITLDMHTGWWDPILVGADWRLEDIRLDKDSRWYQFTIDLLKTAAQASKGKSIPGVGAFGGCGDTLAAMRGTMRLLYDVADRPELVRQTEFYLMEMWTEVYQTFHDLVSPSAGGSTCWCPLWSPGRFYAAQCDFSYMISPRMFAALFVPALELQLRFLDHAVYHVDGIEAFRHVPVLCELPRLQAIQILPGAGKPSPLHYMDVLK